MTASKRKGGRPPIDSEAVNVRMERQMLDIIDHWRREQSNYPNRPEAIRRLLKAVIYFRNEIPKPAFIPPEIHKLSDIEGM